jgi:hypothetical protein
MISPDERVAGDGPSAGLGGLGAREPWRSVAAAAACGSRFVAPQLGESFGLALGRRALPGTPGTTQGRGVHSPSPAAT